jgi:hypothetical protein
MKKPLRKPDKGTTAGGEFKDLNPKTFKSIKGNKTSKTTTKKKK